MRGFLVCKIKNKKSKFKAFTIDLGVHNFRKYFVCRSYESFEKLANELGD